jgi:hypothetical protein
VRYIYTQIAYSQLRQTQFEDAGNNFFRAETDARALIRLFPDLCEGLPEYSKQDETMAIFRGLESVVRGAGSIEEIGESYVRQLRFIFGTTLPSNPSVCFPLPLLSTAPSPVGLHLTLSAPSRGPLTSPLQPSAQLLAAPRRE